MAAFLLQLFNGLSYASTLFVMAAGLTLIFGVTRIVNFAHGSFYMLGAMVSAHCLVRWFPDWADSAALYALAIALGAAVAAGVGAVAEWAVLRRLYGVPELYQLVATFGLSLFLHDAMLWTFGPNEVFAPRFPGLKGSIEWSGEFFPEYQVLTIVLGPVVWGGLHWLLHHTGFGSKLRAVTQDRAMLGALGVNPGPIMVGVVVLGCALAGFGGALQLPREPVNLQMDMNSVVETFVVVVTGGLGSLAGAFWASVLIGVVHAFGTSFFPQATLVMVFATMGVVLALRPRGLMGQVIEHADVETGHVFRGAGSFIHSYLLPCIALAVVVFSSLLAGPYAQSIASDAMVMMILGISLQCMMAFGGMVSFGHAAYFGLGAYGAALAHLHWGWGLGLALPAGMVCAAGCAVLTGWVMVRSSGVYMAMLSLALAQVVWASASQWVALTGGDNGLIGLQLVTPESRTGFFALLLLCALGSLALLRRLGRSSLGAALQALRDAPERAQASGIPAHALQFRVLVLSAALAGLAGGLFAAHKGAVFPTAASVSMSVDALLVVLMGGVHHLFGAVAGAGVLTWTAGELGRGFDYWRGALGLVVMVIMVMAPAGLMGALTERGVKRRRSAPGEAS